MAIAKSSGQWILTPLTLGIITILPYVFIRLFLLLILAIIWFIITGVFVLFFRDPERVPPANINYILAPADGKINKIEICNSSQNTSEALKDSGIAGSFIRISTFMNIHNVHVNRAPMDGKIIKIDHKLGTFKPAFNKDSDENERVIITMNTKLGTIKVIQIAGIFARRIVPYIEKNSIVRKGERIGIIRFGSRVDLILPCSKVKVKIKVGDKVNAGSSIVAKIIQGTATD